MRARARGRACGQGREGARERKANKSHHLLDFIIFSGGGVFLYFLHLVLFRLIFTRSFLCGDFYCLFFAPFLETSPPRSGSVRLGSDPHLSTAPLSFVLSLVVTGADPPTCPRRRTWTGSSVLLVVRLETNQLLQAQDELKQHAVRVDITPPLYFF